jgi:hypothetical protein
MAFPYLDARPDGISGRRRTTYQSLGRRARVERNFCAPQCGTPLRFAAKLITTNCMRCSGGGSAAQIKVAMEVLQAQWSRFIHSEAPLLS